jgi:hypothetical protein
MRRRLTYANVVATLALFMALSGGSYAAIRVGSGSIVNNSVRTQDLKNNEIRGRDIRNRTIQGGDLANNTIRGQQVRESTLSKVPDADKLDGADSSSFRLSCPAGTQRHAGGCIETSARGAATFNNAARFCGSIGRRLPGPDELGSFSEEPGITLGTPRELTSVRIGAQVDGVSEGPVHLGADPDDALPYRCVAPLSN